MSRGKKKMKKKKPGRIKRAKGGNKAKKQIKKESMESLPSNVLAPEV